MNIYPPGKLALELYLDNTLRECQKPEFENLEVVCIGAVRLDTFQI
jgi:hypothetical protein